jgi:hypothetical protein
MIPSAMPAMMTASTIKWFLLLRGDMTCFPFVYLGLAMPGFLHGDS